MSKKPKPPRSEGGTMVVYKSVPPYPANRVRIGSDGTVGVWVDHWKRWHTIKGRIDGGCVYVRFRFDGRDEWRSLARLVCRAFHGPRPLGHEAYHFPDTDRRNCRADNLRWAPRSTSKLGKQIPAIARHGNRGEHNPRAVLTADGVIEARRMARDGWSCGDIADEFGVSPGSIRQAVNGVRWKSIPGAIPDAFRRTRA